MSLVDLRFLLPDQAVGQLHFDWIHWGFLGYFQVLLVGYWNDYWGENY